jgi:drug/metabolite transporter (DMT)-like permease
MKAETMRPVVAPATKAAPNNTLAIILALLSLYIIWGSTYLAIRIALEGFPPFFMAGVRFLAAGALMYGFLRLRGTPNPTRRQWGGAALVGGLLLVGGNGGVVFAEQWVASGVAALGVGAVPLWAALFAGLWGNWPQRREWVGIALGLVGLVLLNLDGDMRANPWGAVFLIGATMSWALGSVWARRLPLPPGAMASAAEMIAGGAILLLIALVTGEHVPATLPGARPLGAVIYLAIFGSIIAFSAYGYLLRNVRPAVATSYAYANPVVAVLLGAVVASERITPLTLGAMAIILLAVAIVTSKPSRAH